MTEHLEQDFESPQPTEQPKAPISARLLSAMIVVYAIACAIEFIFVATMFGLSGAVAILLLASLPALVAVRIRRQWYGFNEIDTFFLIVVAVLATYGQIAVLQEWYQRGYHLRPQGWTFFHPPSQEDLNWTEFGKEIKKDPAFRDIRIMKTQRKQVYYVSDVLESESDLNRLLSLATKCRIAGNRLAGPYADSVSITIPGTSRATRYRTSD